MNRKPIFDWLRTKLGRGVTQAEVSELDALLGAHELARPAAFFATVRAEVGPLDQVQVDTINALLAKAGYWPLSWMSYALATAWHESRLRPIREMGSPAYLTRYEGRADLGNNQVGDGIRYAGRGLVQLTGRRNYTNAGEALGLDLLGNPDLALEPANAVRLLVWGMEGGKFTGRSLRDYLPGWHGTFDQYKSARRIINGTDRAEMVAGYAGQFQAALLDGGYA